MMYVGSVPSMNHVTLLSYDHEVTFLQGLIEFILVKKYELYRFINGYFSIWRKLKKEKKNSKKQALKSLSEYWNVT